MKIMIKIYSFLIAIMLFVVSCNNVSNQHKDNEPSKLKIVSLAPSITKELQDLGLTDNIVGATTYCAISATNKNLIIGTATDVNIEKILLLHPDMVFATGLTKETTIETLRKNGLKVYVNPKMESFEEICQRFIKLGELVGKADLAKKIVNQSVHKIDSLKSLVPVQEKKKKVFIQIGAKPLFAVIGHTFMDDYITYAGCENIASDLKRGSITRESVLERNPDVIFIVTMGVEGDGEKNAWDTFSELSASKNKKIFVLDSNIACTPTVLSFTETLETIIKKIY